MISQFQTGEMRPTLPALTSIRFFAALWVVVFHLHAAGFSIAHDLPGARWAHNLILTGYCGVGIFFVLSGFILTYNYFALETNGPRLQRYWVARAARVLPVYFLGLALDAPNVIAGALKSGGGAASLVWFGGVLLACLLLVQAWIPRLTLAWNGPGWSLSDEAFFYAVFPYALRPLRQRPNWVLWAALLLLQLVALIPPICALVWQVPGFAGISASEHVPPGDWPNFLKFFPLFRLPEFLFGMVLGILYGRTGGLGPLRQFGSAIALAGATAIIATCTFLADAVPYALLHNGLLLIPFGMLIFGLAHSQSAFARLLSARWLEKLGCASYALYIIHIPMIQYAKALQRRLHLGDLDPIYSILPLLAGLIVLSVLIWRYYEEPARSRIMRIWKARTLARVEVPR